MKFIKGGVCAAKGFKASGIHCGIRKNRTKKDLMLIYSEVSAKAGGVYTTNKVKGAPIGVTKKHIGDGVAQAIICNSGIANTCCADGVEKAEQMSVLAGKALGISPDDIVVASTGVIGEALNIEPIAAKIDELAESLSVDGCDDAAEAIMTTDTIQKKVAVSFEIGGRECHIGGIAKGSGMIHPNLATMLVFITTDVSISQNLLQKALSGDIKETFNMMSIDGDTSTNDMVMVLANGMAGNEEINSENEDYAIFMKALNSVNIGLCRLLAGDGEGATKLLECHVTGAVDICAAKLAAKSVVCSNLVKSAMFGADANWGRIICAVGYSGADINPSKIDLKFSSKAGEISVCKNGSGIPFSEELAKKILSEDEIDIWLDFHSGSGTSTAWGCDLTYDYVKINGDYRT